MTVLTASNPAVQNPTSHATHAPMKLRELLPGYADAATAEIALTDLTLDSRAVRKGSGFLALKGTKAHGLSHAQQAAENGAAAILYDAADEALITPALRNLPLVVVPKLYAHLGALADRFFERPSSAMRIAGVTGTNGKTTTAYLVASALSLSGRMTGYIGTLGHGAVGAIQQGTLTTPDCITVHRWLSELRGAGHHYVAMEVSSHALDQERIAGVRIDTAVFTNLTRDHLDYHGTEAAYMQAKAKLFRAPGLSDAVVNVNDTHGLQLLDSLPATIGRIAFSTQGPIDVENARVLWARALHPRSHGLEIDIGGSWGEGRLSSSLIGEFNAENLLGALGVLLAWGLPLARALQLLQLCNAPPGRMEAVGGDVGPMAVIDYAHTPDALDKALQAARAHCAGKLICVFGCGGDRDRGKRPLMGAVAEQRADRVVVTDDNPRSEASAQIIDDILAGMKQPERVTVQPDRRIAIDAALRSARGGDLVLIAGKGHEDYQIVGAEVRHFSDREVALQTLRAHP